MADGIMKDAKLKDDSDCCGGPFGFNAGESQVAFHIEFIDPYDPNEPQRGQFWSYNANRKCCVAMIGKNLSGHWVSVDRDGNYEVFDGRGNMDLKFWHHEPGFTYFDGPAEPERTPEPPSSPAAEDSPPPPAKFEVPKPEVRTIKLIRWIVWDDIGDEEELWSADRPCHFANAYDTGDFKLQQLPVKFL